MDIINDYVMVDVSNSGDEKVVPYMAYPKNITVGRLKNDLQHITSASPETMQLQLFKEDRLIASLRDNKIQLRAYPIKDGMRIHVIDDFPWIKKGVEPLRLTEEQYNNRENTIRNFLKKNRLGRYTDDEVTRERRRKEFGLKMAQKCTLNARCEVSVIGIPKRRGTIKYKGPLEGKEGVWIGVQYDKPLGKNDGSFNGQRYFYCMPNYGGFVEPNAIKLGEFPPQ